MLEDQIDRDEEAAVVVEVSSVELELVMGVEVVVISLVDSVNDVGSAPVPGRVATVTEAPHSSSVDPFGQQPT